MSNALTVIVSMQDMERMADAVAKSGLFGMKTPEQALALMLVAQAEGLHPATAAMEYDIIQNKPARKSSAMLARFQQAGGKIRFTERTDKRVAAIFSHPQGGEIEIDWDMERAKRAGLGSKPNWNAWPRQMLTARVISEGVRAVFPGATGMFYEPGEVADMVDVTPPKPKASPTGHVPNKETIIPHDPETGEIKDTDPWPKSDNVGGDAQTAMKTIPAGQQTDESERAYDWANAQIAKIYDCDSVAKIEAFLKRNKDQLARCRAANEEAASAVVAAADEQMRKLGAGVPA